MKSGELLNAGELEAAAVAADFAANAKTFEEEMVAMTRLAEHQRAIHVGLAVARMNRFGGPAPGHERLPLMDEGHEFGRIESRIPEDLFWGLYFQKDVGPEAFFSAEGIRDINKAFPVCRTKTVSGKTTVGWTLAGENRRGGESRRRGVVFGRGTIELAK